MTLQEKLKLVHYQSQHSLGPLILEIASEVSRLQTANSVLLSHIADLDEIARLVSKEYETMRTVAEKPVQPEGGK